MSAKLEYNTKGMPFRRLGSSGLRVPLFSLGGCKCNAAYPTELKLILHLKGSPSAVPCRATPSSRSSKPPSRMVSICLIQQRLTPKENQSYRCAFRVLMRTFLSDRGMYRGRAIKVLGLRRTDLIVTTKLFWGLREGPNDGGLSWKQ